MRRTTALIAGGGPAGTAAAIVLARAGVESEVFERTQAAHDTVCGGFLGWDALAALDRLNVNAVALGARPITRVRLLSHRQQVEFRLPKPAAGLSRRTLDEALLQAAASAGARVTRGRSVRAADPGTHSVRLNDREEIAGDALFIATGKHELRGVRRPTRWTNSGAIGLRTALFSSIASASLEGVIELHLFDGGYAGLLLQDDGTINLCISVAKERLTTSGSTAALLIELANEAPLLGERLAGPALHSWQSIAGVPYGWRAHDAQSGVFRLGDQSAVVSSLAGDGVAIALTSGIEAASAFIRDGAAGAIGFQKAFARKARLPLKVADLLRWAAERPSFRPTLLSLGSVPSVASLAARLTRIG